MRLSFFVCAPVAAVLALAFACSNSDGGGGGNNADIPEGGSKLDDGAIVGPDGEIVMPDTSQPSLVDVTPGNLPGYDGHPSYVLAVPKNYSAARQYPLIVVLHGDGGDGTSMRSYHTVDDATGSDAIVVYGSGTDHTWDIYTPFDMNEGQQYIEALIAAMKAKYSIDPQRIFGVGWSKGAFIVNQMQCRRGNFRAFASHAGGAPYEQPDNMPQDSAMYLICPNSPKAAAFITHGSADGTVDPSSGDFDAKAWAHYNGCDPDTRVPTTPAPCQTHASCPADKPVTFCLIPGNNHGIWTGAVAAEWAFFKAIP